MVAALLILAYAGARLPLPLAVFDNLSNFPVHFATSFLTCAAAFLVRRQWAFAAAAAAAAVIAGAQFVPWYFGDEAEERADARPLVKLLISNVYYHNRRTGRVQRLVAEEDPDVVGLVEVDGRWLNELGELRARYPHRYELPAKGYVGLALYSRLPLANARTVRLKDGTIPAIAATLTMPAGDVELVLVHTSSPIDAAHIQSRNQQIRELASFVRKLGRPVVLAGDLNLTMWNRGYRPLADAGLRNARAGRGVTPTWPAPLPLGVPIDHVLATGDVRLRDFRVLRPVGSDHLPIAAAFASR